MIADPVRDILRLTGNSPEQEGLSRILRAFPGTEVVSRPQDVDEVPKPDGLIVRTASEIQPRNVEWLWEGRIARGSLTQLVGWPDQGKSTLAIELSARVSRGQLAGDLLGAPSDVLIATAEDDPDTTLVPRLLAAGAALERVHFVSIRKDGLEGSITLPDDLAELREAIHGYSISLTIVDPLLAHIPERIDSHKDQAARRALGPLAALAQEEGVAVLGLIHLNKAAGTTIFTRSGASIAFLAAARNALLAGPDPSASQDGPDKVLIHPKHNLSQRAPTLRYRLEGRELDIKDARGEPIRTSGIAWTGQADDVSDSDVLGGAGQDHGERADASEFLRTELADGPVGQKAMQTRAEQSGISRSTLRRAKKDLGIVSRKQGMEGGWVWTLPEEVNS